MAKEKKPKTKTNMVKDPVCGKEVDPADTIYASTYKGATYYFDSLECKKTFEENPGAFIV